MSDAHALPIKQGEELPFYGTASAPTGSTHTVSGTSTATLWDKDEVVVAAVNGVNVTGQEAGAQLDLDAWYILKPATLALANGLYRLVITIAATGSDSIPRVFKTSIMILVQAASA